MAVAVSAAMALSSRAHSCPGFAVCLCLFPRSFSVFCLIVCLQEYVEKASSLAKSMYPVEMDETIPHQQKVQIFADWWSRSHALMMEFGLTKKILDDSVECVCLPVAVFSCVCVQ